MNRTPIYERPWNVYTKREGSERCGAYVIAEFPIAASTLYPGLTIAAGDPRASDAGIYPPAIDLDGKGGGVPICELEKAFRIMAAAPDLLAACKALPDFDLENPDASDFKDHAAEFMEAMRLARAAIAKAEGCES